MEKILRKGVTEQRVHLTYKEVTYRLTSMLELYVCKCTESHSEKKFWAPD